MGQEGCPLRLFVLRTGLFIIVLLAGAAEGVQASTVFSDPMNSGLDSNIEINLQNGATGGVTYVPVGGPLGGFQQLAVDSTDAGDPWYAGFGMYGGGEPFTPILNTIPVDTPLSATSFTLEGMADGGAPLNVGLRLEAWDGTNANELGFFYLVPITLGGSGVFQKIGGTLDTFGFVPVGAGITDAQDAVNQAAYWRFNYSFGGLTTDSISTDNAFPTYGLKPNNVLGMDDLLFQFDSSTPEPATGFLVAPLLVLLLFASRRSRPIVGIKRK
jgi:hypothetical protein